MAPYATSLTSNMGRGPLQTQSGPIQSSYYGSYSPQPPLIQLPPQMLSSSLPTDLSHVQLHPPQPISVTGAGFLMQSPQEEITTIFVVGFPDDMQEREFQNIFTFCPGFEAATLKIPPPSETTPVVSPTNTTSGDSDFNSQVGAVGRKNAGNGPTVVTIGFAKFATRLEALDALRVLNGRKVDAEKNSILKAEMAKKNLHTKRGLSSDNLVMMSGPHYSNVGRRSTIANIQTPKDFYGDSDLYSPPIPRDILSQVDYLDFYPGETTRLTRSASTPEAYNSKDGGNVVDPYYGMDTATSSTNDSVTGLESVVSSRTTSMGGASTNGMRTPASFMERSPYERRYSEIDSIVMNNLLARSTATSNVPSSQTSPTSSTTPNSLASVPLATERRYSTAEAFANSYVANGTSHNSTANSSQRGFNSALYQPDTLLAERMAAVSVNGNGSGASNLINSGASHNGTGSVVSSPPSSNATGNTNGYAPYGTASLPRSVSMSESASRNSDTRVTDYPPCNTLYVGNLPMNTSEDELRVLFSKCLGYKRLCFRQRPSGPLTKAASPYPQCFVEFEDVACASLALRELYGNPLSNSTKGGIRLSYSKNPLGKRSSDTQSLQHHHQQALTSNNSLSLIMMTPANGYVHSMSPMPMSSSRSSWTDGATASTGSLSVLSPPFIPAGMHSPPETDGRLMGH
ncbi:hypothetical protein SeMB42_g01492 [Synchytrium endobioticum]|nr:hypothetical protein SeMB42_g01492 [Synchytrium endobioticum]